MPGAEAIGRRVATAPRRAARLVGLACLLVASAAGIQPPPGTPDEAIRRNNLGVALMDAGTKDPKYFAEAVREFEAAVGLAPRYVTALQNLGVALYYAGQPSRAATTLQDVQRLSLGSLTAHYVLGLLREYEGQYEAAIGHFRQVAARDERDADAWYHLGFCLGKANRPAEAVAPLGRAAALVPYQRRIRYTLYTALTRAGRAAEAQAELERFRALDSTQIRVVEGPKNLLEYLKQGRYAEAVPDSRHAAPPPAPPAWADATIALGTAHRGAALAPDVAGVLAGTPTPSSFFETAANRTRVAAALRAAVSIVDVDRDGRLDLHVLGGRGPEGVFLQRAAWRFARAPLPAGVAALLREATAIGWGDLDNDGWPDLVAAGPRGVSVARNASGRLGRPAAVWRAPGAGAASVALADLDHDGDLDIAVAGGLRLDPVARTRDVRLPQDLAPAPNVVLRNNSDGTFAEIARQAGLDGGTAATRGFWFGDVNDDRAIDAVLVDWRGGTRVFLNRKDGTFAHAPEVRAPALNSVPPGEARAEADLDGDGAVDAVVIARDRTRIDRNTRKPARWITVRAAGYAVPGKVKSNALGIGARVEVRSAGRWERREIRAGNAAGGTDAPEVTFDLGTDARVDFVRAVFPSGVRKTLADVTAGQVVTIEEPLLDVNSCPTLFTWNGTGFEYVTDTLSAGILGELVAPGRYWQPDPDEWVRIEGRQLVERRGGTLEVRFTNPLEEVTYLDRVRLVAVDHDPGVEIHSDERMVGLAENRRPVRVHALDDRRPLARATDHHGHDVGELLAARDRRYFDHFAPRPFKGFAGDWSLTLDIGPVAPGARSVLGLHGWSYWNSSAAVVGATQAGESLYGPALDVLDAAGRWRTATPDLGLPAGLPRPLVVDLGPYLRPGERVVRIRTNRTIHYDEAWVATSVQQQDIEPAPPAWAGLRITEAPLARASLRWLGYPRRVLPDGRLPEVFDYGVIQQHAEWGTHAGLLTKYGDVRPLLAAADDRLVVMGHGEEIALEFDATRLPPLGPDLRRTWFFYGNGFEKGYELYSAHAETVTPLPFQAMQAYPNAGETAPADAGYFEYLVEWNTRPAFIQRPETRDQRPEAGR